MKRIYRVDYEFRWQGNGGAFEKSSVNVLANGDALKAVEKARKHVLATTTTDDKDKEIKIVHFGLLGVTVLAQADV